MMGGWSGSVDGCAGLRSGHIPTSSQRRFAFRRLQGLQAVTMFAQVRRPPADFGTTWS